MQPYPPIARKVKRKRGNVYANLTLIVTSSNSCKIISLNIFFGKEVCVSVKVIEINESVNDGPFFGVIFNSASEFKYIICFRI